MAKPALASLEISPANLLSLMARSCAHDPQTAKSPRPPATTHHPLAYRADRKFHGIHRRRRICRADHGRAVARCELGRVMKHDLGTRLWLDFIEQVRAK